MIGVLGAICFSTKAVLVKLAYRDTAMDAITLLALRMLFSLPFFVFSAAASSSARTNTRFTPRQWAFIGGIGLCGYYLSSLLDFVGLQYISAGMERLILFIYPTLVVLMTAMFFGQPVQRYQWVALGITYAGLAMAFFSDANMAGQGNADFFKGALLIFLCAITYALYIVGSGRLIQAVGASKFNSYAMSFAAVGVLVHFFVSNDNSLLDMQPAAYSYGLAMALLATVVPSYLVAASIGRIGADNLAIVSSIGPVSTLLQAYIFLEEPIDGWQLGGTALILAGVLLIGKKGASKNPSNPAKKGF